MHWWCLSSSSVQDCLLLKPSVAWESRASPQWWEFMSEPAEALTYISSSLAWVSNLTILREERLNVSPPTGNKRGPHGLLLLPVGLGLFKPPCCKVYFTRSYWVNMGDLQRWKQFFAHWTVKKTQGRHLSPFCAVVSQKGDVSKVLLCR